MNSERWFRLIHEPLRPPHCVTLPHDALGPLNQRHNRGFRLWARLGIEQVYSRSQFPARCRSLECRRGVINAFVIALDGKTADASLLGLDSLAPIKAVTVQ